MNETAIRAPLHASVQAVTIGWVEFTEYRMWCEHGSVVQRYCNQPDRPHEHVERTPGQALLRCWLAWMKLTLATCDCRLPDAVSRRFQL